MKHPTPSRSRGTSKVLGALFVIGLVFLFAVLTGRLPGGPDSPAPGSVPLAGADPAKETGPASRESEKPRNQVVVYVTSWCPACRMTTDYLKMKEIPFTVKDIEKNEAYMKEMVRKVGGYRGVPVLDINGRILLGFNPQVLDQLAK